MMCCKSSSIRCMKYTLCATIRFYKIAAERTSAVRLYDNYFCKCYCVRTDCFLYVFSLSLICTTYLYFVCSVCYFPKCFSSWSIWFMATKMIPVLFCKLIYINFLAVFLGMHFSRLNVFFTFAVFIESVAVVVSLKMDLKFEFNAICFP